MDFNNNVSILLATYNSSKFLKDQLDSLINQTYQDWKLFIRDDGSTDDTIDIISGYSASDSRIVLIKDDCENLGAAKSFMQLVKIIESDFYFFCDHDDVWLRDKLETSLTVLRRESQIDTKKPFIVHSDLYVVDQNLNVVNESFWKSSGIKPNVINNKMFIQVFNFVTGCTMGFNRKARDISVDFPENIPMHDWWITLNVLMNGGKVININRPLIYYRQHNSNEVGARNVNFKYFVDRILNFQVSLNYYANHIKFLKSINGHGTFKYYLIRIYYSLIRKI
ncbi:glycosyltransferase family 2 protein [Chryseobacterium sp. 09-1422]|uniref:Glycosyltransferase family 2 protein n=1 Tax=Chryseobacterium kimseyorum TaxID=2984028 RepID=A0ABT3I375_9FLAO|nr:glycosyltransferase family 2 protein [Chryseobacterium kimseyorum]MCW3170512.1 glycosyltransferase family 2 protein [Chryseobacterium kimseyorum]